MTATPRFPPVVPGRDLNSAIPETPPEGTDAEGDFIQHPDGWYWIAPDGHQQFGPFDSLAMAQADWERGSLETVAAAEDDPLLRDVERESGLENVIDIEHGRSFDDGPDVGME